MAMPVGCQNIRLPYAPGRCGVLCDQHALPVRASRTDINDVLDRATLHESGH